MYSYDETQIDWFENPGGIPQNVLSKLPSFLLIPAQDRQEEITAGTGTLQKTLEELFREVRDSSEHYRQAQHYLNLLQDELDPCNPDTEVSKMMSELNDVVSDVFPSASILAHTNLSNPDTTIKPSFAIQMSSNVATSASLQGTGMIRSAVFALLRYKSMRDARRCEDDSRPLIIGFEEPELYLHPNATNKIRETIYRLAENPNNQIVCTTHSPYMIDISRMPHQILNHLSIVFTNQNGHEGETIKIKPFNVTEEFKKLQDDNKSYVKMLLRVDDAISKSFFVKKVLIVEGDTEQIVINETLPFLFPGIRSVIKSDWHIVRARGKAAIIPLIKYFKSMDIDVYVIHDGDYGTAGAEIFNEPIMLALNDNSHLVVLDKCIEDVLNYPVTFSDKPLRAYSFISENWHQWSDISERWRDCIEKIFNNGHRIIIRMGEIQ
ncbi:ATP-dependent nuclease [Anaerotruncus colihominis]|uniref:ATP-dependent nuclease n=1 Tax=Anaerotruncus colihominis TaxID=169435 RepID=UPI00189911CE|nr:AAA family ATPase [Anaerotruncus colihominis]